MDSKMPLKGAGMVHEGPKDPTSMRNEPVQTVSQESASLREPPKDNLMGASPVNVIGRK